RGSSTESDEAVAEDDSAPPPPSDPNPPSEVTGGTTRVAVPTTRPSRATPGQSESAAPDRRGATSRPVIRNALFAVNYPLGDFGRDKPAPPQPHTIYFHQARI